MGVHPALGHSKLLKIEIGNKRVRCVRIWARTDCHCVSRCAISSWYHYSGANFCYHCEYHIGYHNVALSKIEAHCGYQTAAEEADSRGCARMSFWWE